MRRFIDYKKYINCDYEMFLFRIQKRLLIIKMTTVIRGRARKPAPETLPSVVSPTPESTPAREGFLGWAQRKAEYELRRQIFAYELNQEIIKPTETSLYTNLDTTLIEGMIRHYQSQYELNKDTPGFSQAMDQAMRTNNFDFDFDTWEPRFSEELTNFQDYEVVFFRNRTTAFTLPKPCPNCGQKKLIAEGSVFTRAADEAATQFATCKNCSSRFRLQSVL
jgi:DNA-directed RNA polymerase subunit M/transcription elongation factor TFIIS